MTSKFTFLIALIGFVLLIAVAALLYNRLGRDYTAETLVAEPTHTATAAPEAQADSEATAESGSEEDNRTAAPDFTVTDADGSEVHLSDFEGKPVVLNFWASWCGPCQSEMPDFEEAYAKYGEEIHFVMVNATDGSRETVEDAKDFIAQSGYTFPVYYDTSYDASTTYGITGLPTTFFIDAEGYVVAYGVSALDAETLEKGIGMIYQAE